MDNRPRAPRLDPKMLWLLRKEIKSVLRSRWLLVGFIISPLFAWMFQGAFLGFVYAQASVEPERIYITNDDSGIWGDHVYGNLSESMDTLLISQLINITYEEGVEMTENVTISVWIHIPEYFTERLLSNETAHISPLNITYNAASFRASSAAVRLTNYIAGVVNSLLIERLANIQRYPVAPQANYGHQLAIFLVMLTSVLAPSPYVGQSFAGERERHTLEALLVVPMSRLKILFTKLMAGLLLTLIYAAFTVVGIVMYNLMVILRAQGAIGGEEAIAYYSVDLATVPLIVFCQLLVLLTAISIGIVISCLAKDQASAESINNLMLLVPTMVIGILGFTGSILQYGGLFGLAVLAIPFSHAVLFLNGVLVGNATLASLLVNVVYMLVFTIVFLIIGAKLFEREAIIV
ncbi:MAG: ABC transporter permease [Candidatus Thorarchaeota archaeon]|nr:ABC transporter permease [Candidatus Thorarchaeota archaeon]